MTTIDTPLQSAKKCSFTIAIIDSDASLCIDLEKRLHCEGCTVLHAFSPEEIPSVLIRKPDFLLIDPASLVGESFDLQSHLSDPYSAGVVVLTSNPDPLMRDDLFGRGVLELLSKNDSPDYTVRSLKRLFGTIAANGAFHVTIISRSDALIESLRRLIAHRRYSLCVVADLCGLSEKWDHSEHKLPDLLLLHTDQENIDASLLMIEEIRHTRMSELPIIVLSDAIGANPTAKLFREGVNEVIELPYSPEKLFLQITSHLDNRIDRKILNYEKNLSLQIKTMIDSKSIVSKTDSRGIITYVNERFAQMSGYSAEELIGKPHNIIRHPDNSPLLFKEMWETIRSKKIFRGIIRNRRKDGANYYVDSMITPIIDDNDKIVEYISIRHDITELIEKQHELENQRRQVQNVLDAQTSLICMVDHARGVVQSNRGFMEFLGVSSLEPEICGFHDPCELFLDVEGGWHLQNHERGVWLERLYEMRGKFVKVAMKDLFGNPCIFAIHVEKIPDQHFSGGVCHLVSLEDVSELSRALREAQLASEAESRFLATMSHEIRTPLNGILGFAELLRESALNDEQKKYLQAIEYSGDTLRQIINDILEVMKLQREDLELNAEPIHLIRELEAILYPFYAQAARKGVELLCFIDPQLPVTVYADILRLKQVLINLISNAIKFTSAGKKVRVRAKLIGTGEGSVRIGFSVADEGIGVKPEHKEAIFKPFVQADNSIAREFGGTGLGLNIVVRVVDAMEGKLFFRSTEGKGSIFHARLTFGSDGISHAYRCQKAIRLYLPAERPSPRFSLVEAYLKRFGSLAYPILHTGALERLEDREDLVLVLFAQMMSSAQIADAIGRFSRAALYLIPPHTDFPLVSKPGDNVVVLPKELTWSSIARGLDICESDDDSPSPDTESATFRGVRILVAEDNDVNRFFIEETLKKLDIASDIAVDGHDAVTKFTTGKYDLVLMDINMPNLDGISAMQQILRYEQELNVPHTPIIGLSADAVEKNIRRYLHQGLDGYLIKPLRKSDLVALLTERFEPCPSHPLSPEPSVEPNKHTSDASGHSLALSVAARLELPEEIIRELFRKFIANAQMILEGIDARQNDRSGLKIEFHSLKGIAKNLYLEPLGSICARIEADLPSLSGDELATRLNELRRETRNAIRRMEEELSA